MVYALLVDFHRDADRARAYSDFLELTSGKFARGTVALGYFENHDSPRATRVWRERYAARLAADPGFDQYWREKTGSRAPAQWMALLRNIQASLIDATAGSGTHTNLAYGLEWGTNWGVETETDFEHSTVLEESGAAVPPGAYLTRAYEALSRLAASAGVIRDGAVYFWRSDFPGGDPEDRLFAYFRHNAADALLVAHNLDPQWTRRACIDLSLPLGEGGEAPRFAVAFDTYPFFFSGEGQPSIEEKDGVLTIALEPLRSVVVRVGRQRRMV
jgi:hypothetical protein